jgi:CMP-N-acetylneuraminate monooxygenase
MTRYKSFSISINPESLSETAMEFRIDGVKIWICKLSDGVNVFFDECAHMGGELLNNGKSLVCPQHGWTYDFNGNNLNRNSPGLRKAKVLSFDDCKIEVLLPVKEILPTKSSLSSPLEVKVHSHATLELSYRHTSILFDPWLEGSAYYGAWDLYPKPLVSAEDIVVNAIVITHPHPDHFHLQTLKKFDKSIPVFYPEFPSQIIEKGLDELGFINQMPVFWGETFRVGDYVNMQFLRPRSMWEDSATLTWVEDSGKVFTWLSLVDAGSVIDEFALPDLDLLTSAFDQGASGYPLTWTHLSESRRVKLLEAQKESRMQLLPLRARKLKSKYFLPFAGHWRLGQEVHKKYAELIPHTSFQELSEKFAISAPDTEFLGLYPGESFEFLTKTVEKAQENETERLEINFSPSVEFSAFQTDDLFEVLGDFRMLMSKLILLCDAFGSENVKFEVSTNENSYSETFAFCSSNSTGLQEITINVRVPEQILILLAKGKANWDHVAIGYWGEWSRCPDIYPANFMRLLQAGNTSIPINDMPPLDIDYLLQKSVGEIIEGDEVFAPKLLGRLGLPCITCIRSNSETLLQALNIHNVDLESNIWLLRELAARSYSRSAP